LTKISTIEVKFEKVLLHERIFEPVIEPKISENMAFYENLPISDDEESLIDETEHDSIEKRKNILKVLPAAERQLS